MPRQTIVYLGTGEKHGFYTLHTVSMGDGMYVDAYKKNLATTWDKAYAKAQKYAGRIGASLYADPFDLSEVSSLRGAARWRAIIDCLYVGWIPLVPYGKYKDHRLNTQLYENYKQYFWWMLHNLRTERDDDIPFRVHLACILADSGDEDPIEKRQEEYQKATDTAEPVPLTDTRIKFTGTVIGTKTQFSYWGDTLKVLFQDDRGFKLWGSAPEIKETNMLGQEQYAPVCKGDRIEFMARVQISADDAKFGFFSRPTKAKFIVTEE